MFTVGVNGLIFDNQKRVLLVLRNDMDAWCLPGGGLEQGESLTEAVKREVIEETGLVVEIKKLIGVYTKQDKNDIVFSFLCEVVNGELKIGEESKELKWFSVSGLPENFPPKQKERIDDALLNSPEVIIKHQAGPSSRQFFQK